MHFTQMSLSNDSIIVHGFKNGIVSGMTYSHILEWIRVRTEGSLVVTSTLIINDKLALRRVTTADIGGKSESIFDFGSIFTGCNRLSLRGEPKRRDESTELVINGDIDGIAMNKISIELPSSEKEGMKSIKNNIDASLFSMADGSKMPEMRTEPIFSEVGKIISKDIDSSITEYISSSKLEVDTCSLKCTVVLELCVGGCWVAGVLAPACAALCGVGLAACLVYCAS